MRKHGGFRKGGNISKIATASDIYHMCGNVRNFMRDCPMANAEIKEYQNVEAKKTKERTWSLIKMQRKLQIITP